MFSNLPLNLEANEIYDVATTVGATTVRDTSVRHVEMQYDKHGAPEGRAVVTFKSFALAEKAVDNLHLCTLDGVPMQVKMLGPIGGAQLAPAAAADAPVARSPALRPQQEPPVRRPSHQAPYAEDDNLKYKYRAAQYAGETREYEAGGGGGGRKAAAAAAPRQYEEDDYAPHEVWSASQHQQHQQHLQQHARAAR
ncbi:hypothetical protein JKP88DRAFT_220113 [Tribonema minus]|uniref:RRM domain-containing protein n=1 Tax=Tribonema minus TaxID=303371 RepID=A0A835YYD7_9STRA|nr:hypothetical protein JKP88DRAFT_220113 [Tribonema minus]